VEPKTEPLPEGLRFPTNQPAPATETTVPGGSAPAESPQKQETPPAPAAGEKSTPDSNQGTATGPRSPFVQASYRQEESADKPIDEVADSTPREKTAGNEEAEYKPLAEVEGEIRRNLAREKFQKILAGLQERMTTYRNAKLRYDVDVLDTAKGSSPKPPEKLDFPALAKENGLSANKTDLISTHEAALLDIGKSTAGGSSFISAAFETLPEYRPATAQDDEGNEYLFWKTQETEGREPKFEDEGIRAEVLRAWKMAQARDDVRGLAAILADELGKKLRGSAEQSLAAMSDADLQSARNEAFRRAAEEGLLPNLPQAGQPDLEVIETEPFSWMSYGSFPAFQAFMYQVPPRLGEIKAKVDQTQATPTGQDAVAAPGDDFMRAVYALDLGAIGVAMNRPMTAAYVVRVAESNPSREVLWGTFLVDMKLYAASYNLVAGGERREIADAWRKEIQRAAGFKWERQPDRTRRR
jgi:hypothetical protein